MDDFLILYPRLIKYIPNWLERFCPSMAQFAKGGLTFRDEKDAIKKLTKGGDTIEQTAHSSWSSSRVKGLEFAKMKGGTRTQPVLVETVNKTGAPMANLSAFKNEMEVIVPKGAKHKILSIAKEADVLIIKTVEILK